MSLSHTLPLLGSLVVLAACASAPATPSATTSPKEKAVTSATETHSPKRIMDGSRPFTMPEIEERLLKVLALPPAQISKENVEKIFGVVLEGNDQPWFFEEISADKQVVFAVTTYANRLGVSVFRYRTAIKKVSEDDKEEYWEEMPREVPAAYKFPYPDFVRKLEKLGWKAEGVHRNVGYYWNYFVKDGYLMKLHIDDYSGSANEQPDYSQTGISRIVIDAPNKR